MNALGPEYFQSVPIVDLAFGNGRRKDTDKYKVDETVMAALARLPEIETLELSHNQTVKDDSLKHLCGLSRLKVLYLFRTQVRGPGLEHLRDCDALESITLTQSPVGDDVFPSLNELRGLKHLILSRTNITDAGLTKLSNDVSLETLYLSHTNIGDAALRRLESMQSLKSLTVDGTNVTAAGVERFKTALPLCTISTDYDLGREVIQAPLFPPDSRPTAAELNALLKASKIDGEVSLDANAPDAPIVYFRIFDSMLGDEAIAPLVRDMPRLTTLNLRRVAVGDDLLREVANLPDLNYLSLHGTRVTDAGLRSLTGLTKLSQVILDDTDITDAGLPAFYELQNLESLSLQGTRVTRDGVDELKRRLPQCNVNW